MFQCLHLPIYAHYSHDGTTGKLVAGIQGCDNSAEKASKNPLSSPGPLMDKKRHSNDVDQISHSQVADINVRDCFFPRSERNGDKLRSDIESKHPLQYMSTVIKF